MRIRNLSIVLFLLISTIVSAQTIHHPSLVFHAGYHGMSMPAHSAVANASGADLGLGFEYRMAHRHFVLLTGLEAAYKLANLSPADAEIRLPHSIDENHLDFTYIYQVSDRYDRYHSAALQVPFLLGVGWKSMYLAAGVKAELMAYSQSQTTYQVMSYGEYAMFLDPFTNMPEHQFFGGTAKRTQQSVSLDSRLYGSMVIGYTINKQNYRARENHPEMTIAAYIDYAVATFSLGHSMPKNLEPLLTPDQFTIGADMLAPVQANHLLSTNQIAKGTIRPWNAGLRFSISFPIRQGKRYPCMCSY